MFFLLHNLSFGAGLPMMYRITPEDNANLVLSGLIIESLERISNGSGMIQGSECTTPNHYFEAIKKYHPSAVINSVDELPAYIRGLHQQKMSDVSAPRKLSRILFSKSECKLDLEGWSREIRPDESVWVDPNTGEIILAGDCMNVVQQESSVGVVPELPLKKSDDFTLCKKESERPIFPLRVVTTRDELIINFPGEKEVVMFWLEDSKGREVFSSRGFVLDDGNYRQWYNPRVDCNREVYIKWWDYAPDGRYWPSDQIDKERKKITISIPESDVEHAFVFWQARPTWTSYLKGKLVGVKYEGCQIIGKVLGEKKKFFGGNEEVPLSRVVYLFNEEGLLVDRIMTNESGYFLFQVEKGGKYKISVLYPVEKQDENGKWFSVLSVDESTEDSVIVETK